MILFGRRGFFLFSVLLVVVGHVESVNPLYMAPDVGGASWSSGAGFAWTGSKALIKGNSLFNAIAASPVQNAFRSTISRSGRQLIARPLFPAVMAVLKPIEAAWKFYVKRHEIQDELITQGLAFAKKNSVRALGYVAVTYVTLDMLARLGVFGKRGEGILRTVRRTEVVQEAVEEKVFEKVAEESVDLGVEAFSHFRRWGERSKFAVALSAGAFFSRSAVATTVFLVKGVLGTFFALECLSFVGIIDEPGEKIMEWVDHRHDQTAKWMKNAKKFRKTVRKHLSLKAFEEFYEIAVEEERVAFTGFAIGSLMAMF